jgi:hypothetical protein
MHDGTGQPRVSRLDNRQLDVPPVHQMWEPVYRRRRRMRDRRSRTTNQHCGDGALPRRRRLSAYHRIGASPEWG